MQNVIMVEYQQLSNIMINVENYLEKWFETNSFNEENQIKAIAHFVANKMGGICVTEKCDHFSVNVETSSQQTVFLFQISKGHCHHRALFFKILLDVLKTNTKYFKIPCSLHKTKSNGHQHAWNTIKLKNNEFVVDIMHQIGNLKEQ